MRSIGIDLQRWLRRGLLRFEASRPQIHGLEMHLTHILRAVEEFRPSVVVVDPVSNFTTSGTLGDSRVMLLRLMDYLKAREVTALLVSLTEGDRALEASTVGISSMIDTWILTRDIELGGERNRALYVLKSRGMPHSNQIREFLITDRGIELRDVYVGPEGVLTGSMRVAQEDRERAARVERRQEGERRRREAGVRRAALEAQIAALRAELEAAESASDARAREDRSREETEAAERAAAGARRGADASPARKRGRP
jgi:circadian clock protein KaiC